MKLEKVLIIPDTHFPYHDKKAWTLMLKAAKAFRPDIVVTLGDFGDFYAVSAHSKDPNRKRNLEWEIDAINEGLDEIDRLGARKKVFISGNHEYRLERYLMDKAPELFNVVKVRELFRLKERGWQYVPYKSDTRIGKLYVTHDCGSSGLAAVRNALSTYQHNVSIGHTHRLEYRVEGNASGDAHVAASFGWLGDRDQTDYMHQVKAKRDWALGFGTGYLLPDGTVHLTPVPIVNYACILQGKYYD